jgi:serine/threonine protein kinase
MQEEALQQTLAHRFVLVKKVGEGGMGRVYEVLDRETGERLALKMLPRLSGERLYRFKREFRALDE